MRVMGYQVMIAVNPSDLKMQVNAWLDEGWKQQGGVSITRGLTGLVFAQAVVLLEE